MARDVGTRSLKFLIMLDSQLECREKWMLPPLFSFYSVWDSNPWNYATHIYHLSFHLISLIREITSQVCPGICFHGYSKSHQAYNRDYWSQMKSSLLTWCRTAYNAFHRTVRQVCTISYGIQRFLSVNYSLGRVYILDIM